MAVVPCVMDSAEGAGRGCKLVWSGLSSEQEGMWGAWADSTSKGLMVGGVGEEQDRMRGGLQFGFRLGSPAVDA